MWDAIFDGRSDADLAHAIKAHGARVRASKGRGDPSLLGAAEAAVRADRGAIAFDASGHATVTCGGRVYAAGRFEVASIASLEARARARKAGGSGRARLWLFDGAAPSTDIASMQAFAPEGALFQVASQFNCLEAPGPRVVPVAAYLSDPTQGPRASVSAFPATLVRHYAAPGPDGARFEQTTGGAQLDLLAGATDAHTGGPRSGYLDASGVRDGEALLASLRARFDAIAVGVNEGAEVVLGYAWDGGVDAPAPRIAQVFTSTVAGGGYGGESLPAFDGLCEVLLRAAYTGTLLTAAALGSRVAVLTLIGGGVFGNAPEAIWSAIGWALDRVEPLLGHDLEVIVNGRDLGRRMKGDTLMGPVRARGGAIVAFGAIGDADRVSIAR